MKPVNDRSRTHSLIWTYWMVLSAFKSDTWESSGRKETLKDKFVHLRLERIQHDTDLTILLNV